MRVLLRCDSTKTQGLGHLVRCVAVGEAAREAGWDVVAAGDVESPLGRRLLRAVARELHPRPASPQGLARLAREAGAAVVHLDTYDDEGDVRVELAKVGILLSSIEDGEFGRRPADLAIDPSAGAELAQRPEDGTLRLARGTPFIPVRSVIRALRGGGTGVGSQLARGEGDKTDDARRRPRVVVVMGGTDARDATSAAVRLWARAEVPSHCTAVVPGGAPLDVGPLPEGLSLEAVGQTGELPRLFAAADLVLSGAGTTIWELAALGVPMAIIRLVENQAQNYAYAVERGMAAGLGGFGDDAGEPGTLRRVLTDSAERARLAGAARSVVDADGAPRIVALWEDLIARPDGVSVRRATPSDASRLFDWRNDPAVRAASRSTAELQWDEHVAWLGRTLGRDDVVLLLAEADGQAVGTVRFDACTAPDEHWPDEHWPDKHWPDEDWPDKPRPVEHWEVSITLAPGARGRRLAPRVLAAAEEALRRDHPCAALHAVMRAGNEPSYRLFLGAGYTDGSGAPEPTDDGGWYRLVKAAEAKAQPGP